MPTLTTLPSTLLRAAAGPPDLSVRSLWRTASLLPAGKAIFTRAVCLKAPYFGTIHPQIEELRPGHCVVRVKGRRGVHNHLGTVHAIAGLGPIPDHLDGADVVVDVGILERPSGRSCGRRSPCTSPPPGRTSSARGNPGPDRPSGFRARSR